MKTDRTITIMAVRGRWMVLLVKSTNNDNVEMQGCAIRLSSFKEALDRAVKMFNNYTTHHNVTLHITSVRHDLSLELQDVEDTSLIEAILVFSDLISNDN